jgi:hypothetical protein
MRVSFGLCVPFVIGVVKLTGSIFVRVLDTPRCGAAKKKYTRAQDLFFQRFRFIPDRV